MKQILIALSLCLVTGCASLFGEPPVRDYTLCFLLTDRPVDEFEESELSAAMAGHFENMGRLGDSRLLLMAGPLGEPRSNPLHRGIFLFDIEDVNAAEAMANTDPAVRAGVFKTRLHAFRSADPFIDLPRMEAEALYQRRIDDPEAEEWIGRPYVLVSCADGDAAEDAMGRITGTTVLFTGRLGGDLEGTAMFGLDIEDVDQARLLVELAGPDLEWSLHPWYGTERLEEFVAVPAE